MTESAREKLKEKVGRAHSARVSQRRSLDEALDEGLRETFPGSDAVSVVQPAPTKEPVAAE